MRDKYIVKLGENVVKRIEREPEKKADKTIKARKRSLIKFTRKISGINIIIIIFRLYCMPNIATYFYTLCHVGAKNCMTEQFLIVLAMHVFPANLTLQKKGTYLNGT